LTSLLRLSCRLIFHLATCHFGLTILLLSVVCPWHYLSMSVWLSGYIYLFDLCLSMSICRSVCSSGRLSICGSVGLSVCGRHVRSDGLSVGLSVGLSTFLSTSLSVNLSARLCLSISLWICSFCLILCVCFVFACLPVVSFFCLCVFYVFLSCLLSVCASLVRLCVCLSVCVFL